MVGKLRVGLVGVGNCASSLIQGVEFYRNVVTNDLIPGLMHPALGGYRVGDIEFTAAFDVNARKVGLDLGEAIGAAPNNTHRFAAVPRLDVAVSRGPTLDGLGPELTALIDESPESAVDVAEILRRRKTDILVSYLPVGAQRATEWYAEQALGAGCAFVNCVPVFIASDAGWRRRFSDARLPLIGDDIKSQVGSTIVHRVLANLFGERGVRIDRTYQLNIGGNADFRNMKDQDRLAQKKISKTQAVTSQISDDIAADDVHIGPSDYVPWLTDRKVAYIRIEGTAFGDVPLNCEVKLEVWDSPNSAGVVIDAVRCAKLALDRGIGGALVGPSSYFMKSPPEQFDDHTARRKTEAFIEGDDA
ncbi:MAG TPA: inositol-3-phosphate synthase [Stellaceae bacterium]|nr:inositol-3-phosphate synthase [Stellaceae bacterium]